jgi:pyruvate/2-oxoglutarate dehydrogenase complex dihydrolipoamide acyltransferase (E2) component
MADPVAVCIPHDNVNDTSALILSWLVRDGDVVQAEQALAEVETSKATFEIPSPAKGVVRTMVSAGTEIPVGDVLCYVGESADAIDRYLLAASKPPRNETVTRSESVALNENGIGVTPAAFVQNSLENHRPVPAPEPVALPAAGNSRFSRKALEVLKANGLNEADFAECGLVRVQDILARTQGQLPVEPAQAELARSSVGAHATVSTGVAVRSENLPRSKRIEAKLLSWSVREAIRSSVTVAVTRRATGNSVHRDSADAERLSAAIIFECARLLRKYPYLNGYCSGGQAQLYEQVNLGYALDAGRGLKVPVFCDADKTSLTKLVDDRRQFLVDYLNDELRPESMSAGTFTITDLSGAGVYLFDPLMVEAQSAILGVGSEYAPSAAGGEAYNLILAFDHRMIDGRMASSFLNDLKQRIQAHEDEANTRIAATSRQESQCSQCSVTAGEIRSARGFLVQIAGEADGKPKYICTTCLQGW